MKTIFNLVCASLLNTAMPRFAADAEVKISQVTKTFAEVTINGTSKGKREINGGPSLKEFAQSLAAEYGVRTFNVSVDGEPVRTAAQADAPVRSGSSVAVQAKDSRGNEEHAQELASNEGMPEAQADGDSTETAIDEPLKGDGATA